MNTINELMRAVLALSEEERALLAQKLLLSLHHDETDPDAEAAWAAEIAARLKAVQSGDLQAQEWRAALKDLRRELAEGQHP